MLQCCPTSDGAACVLIASEDFVRRHHLEPQAIEIIAQSMATDSTKALLDSNKSSIEVAGADMTRKAAKDVYKLSGVKPSDIGVVELHDCFSANEVSKINICLLCFLPLIS